MVADDSAQGATEATIEHPVGAPTSSRRADGRAALVLYERGGARLVEIPAGSALVVGREWPADVKVGEPSLSRQHARFSWQSGLLRVEDLGSTNGTFVREKRIDSETLRSGDVVRLGGVTATVQIASGAHTLQELDTYDSLLVALEEEVARSRQFGRSCALLVIRSLDGPSRGHVSLFCPRIRAALTPVDRLATYSSDSALVLLPEASTDSAVALAQKLVASHDGEPALVAGVAVFPDSATSPAEMVAVAHDGARQAGPAGAVRRVAAGNAPLAANATVVASPKMRSLYEIVRRIAPTPVPVLLAGETGSGKEVLARALHEGSKREGPLLAVNCAALPESLTESVLFGHEKGAFTGADRATKGYFEEAHGGTLFLDEIAELSPGAQAALLRVLESKRIRRVGGAKEIPTDVRIVAATHRDLDAMVAEGRFRADLHFRLNTITLDVPPLRDREEEIAPLAELFVAQASATWGAKVTGVDPEAQRLLVAYGWPGNVRELKNAMERAVAICIGDTVGVDDLPERLRRGRVRAEAEASPVSNATLPPPADADFKERVREFEVMLIVDALTRSGGNQSRAAEFLRIPLRTLVHKLRTYGIKKTYGTEDSDD